jgi:hypothetical protein
MLRASETRTDDITFVLNNVFPMMEAQSTMEVPVNYHVGGPRDDNVPEAQSTPKVSSASEATGRRHHDASHVSIVDRMRIKN